MNHSTTKPFQKENCGAFILEAQCNKSIKGKTKCYSKQIAEQNTKIPGVLVLDPDGDNNTSSEVTSSTAACVDDTEFIKLNLKSFSCLILRSFFRNPLP